MKLDLSRQGRQELPSDFFQKHKDLEELNLQLNNFVTLPPEIGELQSLQKLILSYNKLTALPPEIGQLQNLKELDLGNNNLTELPLQIGYLKNIQKLDLGKIISQNCPPKLDNCKI
jgi:Leucine-rich repeat (LRR) protein